MPTGQIFSYVLSRGFGFIEPSDHGPYVFFHLEDVIPDKTGKNIFSDGTKVSYELIPDWKKQGQFRAGQITKCARNHRQKEELRLDRREEELRLRRKKIQQERIGKLPNHRRILDDPEHIRVHALTNNFWNCSEYYGLRHLAVSLQQRNDVQESFMRNVSPIAVKELDAMFQENKGNFIAVCKALDEEIENGFDGRTEDQEATWERFGIDADESRKAKSARSKKSELQNLEKESEPEVQPTLVKLIEEQESERRQEIKDWIQAQAKEKEKEDEEPEEGCEDEESDF